MLLKTILSAGRSFLNATVILVGCLGSAQADEVRLVTMNYPPYVYMEDGKPSGLAVDIVREVFRRAGRDIKIDIMPWARALDEVKSGGAEAIFPAAKNAEREAFLDYPASVLVEQTIALYARRDSSASFSGDLASLATTKIGIVNQMSYGGKFDAAVKAGVLATLDRSNDSDTNMQKLIAGRFDLMPSNRFGATFIAKRVGALQEIRELSPPIENIQAYVAFAKGRDGGTLRHEVDRILTSMREDGSYDKIVQPYLQ